MSFKNIVTLLVAFPLMVSLTSCGLNTGEKAPPAPTPSYSGDGYSCVGQIPEHMGRYVSNELSEEEVNTFVRCLQKALTSFAQLTRGRQDSSTYAPDEIRRFLTEYFLKQRPISDRLLNEFMVIKQAIIGGEIDRISRSELYTAIEILEDIRKEMQRLRPHLPFLNPRLIQVQKPGELGQNLIEANDALKQSIRTFTARLEKSKRRYPLSNLQTFITEFREFVGWKDHFKESVDAKVWVDFLRQFKQLAVSIEDPEAIRATDWTPLLGSASRWYLTFLAYKVGVQGQPILQGVGLQNVFHLSQEIFDLVEEALQNQPSKVITHQQIANVMSSLQQLKWIPETIRLASLETAMKAVIDRIFGNGNVPPSRRRVEGLTLTTLPRIKEEFYRWGYVQLNLDSTYRPQATILESLKSREVPSLQSKGFLTPDIKKRIDSLSLTDWDEFLRIKTLMRPLYPEGKSRIYLVPKSLMSSYSLRHDFYNLSVMNILRSTVTLIFRGYSEESHKSIGWESGLRSEEMQRFYEDFRDIAVDLELADRRNVNTGTRAFIEGNLFTYASDGFEPDQADPRSRLSFVEAMQLFSFLYSGGQLSSDYYGELIKTTCRNGPLERSWSRDGSDEGINKAVPFDINGKPKIWRDCVRKELPGMIKKYAFNMPGLQNFIKKFQRDQNQEGLAKYVNTILDAAESKHSEKLWMERNEMATLAVIMHYGDAVLTRYDANNDGVLTNKEVYRAIPFFTGFIKKFAQEKMELSLGDSLARGTFLYILIYKQIPSAWSILNLYNLSLDISGELDMGKLKISADFNKQLHIDRTELAEVFRVIIGKLMETPPATVKPLENSP